VFGFDTADRAGGAECADDVEIARLPEVGGDTGDFE
jgi:hypothetical protein